MDMQESRTSGAMGVEDLARVIAALEARVAVLEVRAAGAATAVPAPPMPAESRRASALQPGGFRRARAHARARPGDAHARGRLPPARADRRPDPGAARRYRSRDELRLACHLPHPPGGPRRPAQQRQLAGPGLGARRLSVRLGNHHQAPVAARGRSGGLPCRGHHARAPHRRVASPARPGLGIHGRGPGDGNGAGLGVAPTHGPRGSGRCRSGGHGLARLRPRLVGPALAGRGRCEWARPPPGPARDPFRAAAGRSSPPGTRRYAPAHRRAAGRLPRQLLRARAGGTPRTGRLRDPANPRLHADGRLRRGARVEVAAPRPPRDWGGPFAGGGR